MKRFQNRALSILGIWLFGVGAGAAELRLTEPPKGAMVPLLHPVQRAFLTMPREPRIRYFADYDCRWLLREARWHPLPVTLSWEAVDLDNARFTVLLSTTEDFAKPAVIAAETNSVDVDNLFINRRYYWKVIATSGDLAVTSAVRTFRTEDQAPRLMRVEGMRNMRDLGGRKAMRGKRVKQGMIYRTAAMNGLKITYYTPDELRDSPEHADDYKKIRKRDEALRATIADLEQRMKHPDAARLLPFYWGKTWTVFLPKRERFHTSDYINQVVQLRSIPSDFMGARAEEATMDDKGYFRFPEPKFRTPAIFMQEFEAPEDGTMHVSCGGDWFWDVWINGTQLVDRLTGSSVHPVANDNEFLEVPVRKGKNLVVVLARSGSGGWCWCYTSVSLEQVLQRQVEEATAKRNDLSKVVKARTLGLDLLTPASIDVLRNELGIKSDVDLRTDAECYGMTESPLGKEIRYVQIPGGAYSGMGTERGREGFSELFKVFLDPSSYPLVVHCAGGQDRMGSLAFILNGLLGVDEEELYLDWEASGFWNAHPLFIHRRSFNRLMAVFLPLSGDNITEKIEHYVLACGFTRKDIETYRALMLE